MLRIIMTLLGLMIITSVITGMLLNLLGVTDPRAPLVIGFINGAAIYLVYTRPALVKFLNDKFPKNKG